MPAEALSGTWKNWLYSSYPKQQIISLTLLFLKKAVLLKLVVDLLNQKVWINPYCFSLYLSGGHARKETFSGG